jgi:hypothetical protein
VGGGPSDIATADFNKDGKLDLASANVFSNNVSVVLGNGNGTFTPAAPRDYAAGSSTFGITAADFDGDGNPDVAATNQSSGNVSIMLGNGNGTFKAAVNYVAGSFPTRALSRDFNEDGRLDLAVTNQNTDNVSVLEGNGDGTFKAAVNHDVGDQPVDLTSADINGDDRLDLATANHSAGTVSILLNVSGDDASPTTTHSVSPQPNAAGFNNENVTVTFDAADNEGGSGVKEITYKIGDGQPVTVQGNTATVEISTEGATTISYFATDRAGNKETEKTVTVNLDKTDPADATDFAATAGNKKVDLSWTNPEDDFDTVRIFRSTEGKVTDPESAGHVYEGEAESFSDTALTNGTAYTYTIFTRDVAGNWSQGVTAAATPTRNAVEISLGDLTHTYDGTPKAPTATTNPENLTVDFTYTDEEGSTVENPTDAGTYDVTATVDDEDHSGTATGKLTINKAPLTVTADNATKKYGEANPPFTATYDGFVNEEDGTDLEGALSFATDADAASEVGEYSIVPSGLTSGNYEITFVNGTLTITKATAAISLDNLTHTYDGAAKSATATTTPSGLGVTIAYTQNGEPVESPTNVGEYTVTATIDDKNHEGEVTGTLVISDVTAPDTTINSGPTGSSANNKPTFGFGGSDDVSAPGELVFSYKLDKGTQEGAWSAYSPDTSATLGGEAGLADGRYTFHVRAKDAAENVDASPASQTFRVDGAKPTVTATLSEQPNGASWHKNNVTVTLDATDGEDSNVVSITYSQNGGTPVTVEDDAATISVTAEGVTTIAYRATDDSGNEADEGSVTVKLDKTAPAIACDEADDEWHKGDVGVGCEASDALSGLANPGDSGFDLTASAGAGVETTNASTDSRIVRDAAGNETLAGPVSGIKMDNKAPAITITTPESGKEYALGEELVADYGCSDTGSGVGSGLAACSAPVENGGRIDTSTPGGKTFEVAATDAVGNVAAPVSHGYTVLEAVVEPNTGISLQPGAGKIVFGSSTLLGGRLTADESGRGLGSQRVVIEAKPAGAEDFSRLTTATTTSRGYFAARVSPSKHTEYRAVFAGNASKNLDATQSDVARIEVAAKVSLSVSKTTVNAGQSLVISGGVAPKHRGEVEIRIERAGREVSAQSVELNEDSRYQLSYTPPSPGKYAVVATFEGDEDHAGSNSPTRSFRVE